MKTLLLAASMVLGTGCLVGGGRGMATDPGLPSYVDPSIAYERDRDSDWSMISYPQVVVAVLGLLDVEGTERMLDRMRELGKPIPRPMRVTQIVTSDVLDRLDAALGRPAATSRD